MKKQISVKNQILRAPNMVLLIFNILAFILLSAFWFWFLGSQEMYSVLAHKAHTLNNITKEDASVKSMVDSYIEKVKSDSQRIENVTLQVKQRNDSNIDLFNTYLLPPIIVFSAFLILSLAYLGYSKERWGLTETILIFLIILSFVTEVIFYFVVIENYQFVSITEILSDMVNK